ncbi:MAG: hypothetical protein Q9228_001700 [Teloschistes exilis]
MHVSNRQREERLLDTLQNRLRRRSLEECNEADKDTVFHDVYMCECEWDEGDEVLAATGNRTTGETDSDKEEATAKPPKAAKKVWLYGNAMREIKQVQQGKDSDLPKGAGSAFGARGARYARQFSFSFSFSNPDSTTLPTYHGPLRLANGRKTINNQSQWQSDSMRCMPAWLNRWPICIRRSRMKSFPILRPLAGGDKTKRDRAIATFCKDELTVVEDQHEDFKAVFRGAKLARTELRTSVKAALGNAVFRHGPDFSIRNDLGIDEGMTREQMLEWYRNHQNLH